MKKTKQCWNWLLLVACSLSIVSLQAQVTKQEKAQGWKPLFNGKNFDGWKQLNGEAKYTVENGVIVGRTVHGTPNSFMTTEKNYGDFVLELELMVDNSMNSGVQFRSLSKPDYNDGRVHGYQMEIDPSDRAWSGGIYDEARRGWLYPLDLNPTAQKAFKKDAWNKYRIEAVGNTIRTFINDVPCAHLIDDMTLEGFICLQVHSIPKDAKEGTEVKWKNIKIQTGNDIKQKSWDDTYVVNMVKNDLSAQEKEQGFELLFDGNSFDKWRGYGQPSMTSKRWNAVDGEIHVSKSDGSETGNDIITKETFDTFELKFDFKLTEGANSGVKYFVDEKFNSGGKSGIGLEYQVLDDAKHPDAKMGVVGNRTLASLYDLIPAVKQNARFQKKIGEWNQGRIVVMPNNTVQHWLNGFKVVEYNRGDGIYQALVARSKYKDFDGFGLSKTGHLLLQDHGDEVHFKSLKVRKLN